MNNISFKPKGTIHGSQYNIQNIFQQNAQFNGDAASKDQSGILQLLLEMKRLAISIDDNYIKDDVVSDLDVIKMEVESSTYDNSKVERAMRCIRRALEPIKHVTTVSTLLVHLTTLSPLIAAFLQPAIG